MSDATAWSSSWATAFADLPNTSGFVALMPRLLLPFDLLLQGCRGQATGIYFVDGTKLVVCHNARIRRNKVFRGLDQRGRTSISGGLASPTWIRAGTLARKHPVAHGEEIGASAPAPPPPATPQSPQMPW